MLAQVRVDHAADRIYIRLKRISNILKIVKVNPATHRMTVTDGPYVIHDGFTPYVSMVSLPYAPTDPHTVVSRAAFVKSYICFCWLVLPARWCMNPG